MTSQEFKSLGRYVAKVASAYGLRDWHITLHGDTHERENAGEVSCVYGQRRAHIGVSAEFGGLDADEQRHVVVHELTHIHLDQVVQLVEDLQPLLGKQAFDTFMLGYRQAVEHATDAIASAIHKGFPQP